MDSSNKSIATFSAVVSVVAALALVALVSGIAMDGRLLWLAIGGGAIGALLGLIAGRSGSTTASKVGLWLGVLTLVCSIAAMLYWTPATVTTTEVTEQASA